MTGTPELVGWPDLPKGFYAVEVIDGGEMLGWALFERQVPRTTRSGRRMGRNALRIGAKYAVGEQAGHRIQRIAHQREAEWIAALVADPEPARVLFGQVTGKCGCCGKKLHDATSKLLGIGPDCRRAG